jgi:DNA segregation ATPase FtsK/SpoIIIE-like protein
LLSAKGVEVSFAPKVSSSPDVSTHSSDPMLKEVVKVIINADKASASLVQRRLRVGYARAARLIEILEKNEIISKSDGARPRSVLVKDADKAMGILNRKNNKPVNTVADSENMYALAVKVSLDAGKSSASFLQRKLNIGYARSAKLIELMEENGVISLFDKQNPGPRKILITDLTEALKKYKD